jgi:hypothetical protein
MFFGLLLLALPTTKAKDTYDSLTQAEKKMGLWTLQKFRANGWMDGETRMTLYYNLKQILHIMPTCRGLICWFRV